MVNRVSFYGQGQRAPLDANPDYPRRQMVEQLMAQAGNDAPIQSHYQGLNQVLQGALGGWMDNRGRQKVADEKALESSEMAKMLSGLRSQEIDYSLPAKYNVGYSGDSAAVGGGDYEGASSADYDGGGFDAPPKTTPGGYAGTLAAPATTPGAKQMQAALMMNQFQDEQALQLAATKRAQDAADAQTIYTRNRTDTLTDAQKKFERDKELASLEKQGEGPFSGTGMDAQAINILLQGDPGSPAYIAAYNHYAQPKVSMDPSTGKITTISPDMSAFRPPMGAGQSAGRPPVAAPVGASIVNVPGASVSTTPGSPPTELNQTQSNAATFSDRMTASEEVLAAVEGQGANYWANLKAMVPGGNYMLSPGYQMFDQAKRDFINAQLRQESGAAIAPSEFENAEIQYFPQPGDSPAVIKQKAANRKIAINGMRRAAGPAYIPPTMSDGPAANLAGTPQGRQFTPAEIDAELKRRGLK